jgi:hypothetical protein
MPRLPDANDKAFYKDRFPDYQRDTETLLRCVNGRGQLLFLGRLDAGLIAATGKLRTWPPLLDIVNHAP